MGFFLPKQHIEIFYIMVIAFFSTSEISSCIILILMLPIERKPLASGGISCVGIFSMWHAGKPLASKFCTVC
jgi:hypothetical protein